MTDRLISRYLLDILSKQVLLRKSQEFCLVPRGQCVSCNNSEHAVLLHKKWHRLKSVTDKEYAKYSSG